jgi:predicted nucleic acid-binding protein
VRRIVSNTGPLLHLNEAQALALLRIAGEVRIPTGVEAEVAYHTTGWKTPTWLAVEVLTGPRAAEAAAWQQAGLLNTGEAEAIALARQLGADWLLTDDAAARLLAQTLGLEVHGSLGIVLQAAAVGHLDRAEADATLERLAASSLWLSPRVLAEARIALDELFRA